MDSTQKELVETQSEADTTKDNLRITKKKKWNPPKKN